MFISNPVLEDGTVKSYACEAPNPKMKITSINFIRLSLIIPYIFAALLYGLSFISGPTMNPGSDLSGTQNAIGFISVIIALTSGVYLLGVIYWFIPYTVLVIFLWIWSKKKTLKQMYRLLLWSPLILAILIPTFLASMSLLNWLPQFYSSADILGSSVCAFPLSLFFGYVFIGVTAWIYDFLKSRNIIVGEEIVTLINR